MRPTSMISAASSTDLFLNSATSGVPSIQVKVLYDCDRSNQAIPNTLVLIVNIVFIRLQKIETTILSPLRNKVNYASSHAFIMSYLFYNKLGK